MSNGLMDEQPDKNHQLNVAFEQRNALRDYYEHQFSGSIETILATWTKEKLDKVALDNGRMFAHRFGFEATQPVRQIILELQKRFDFSDREIRSLKQAGYLRIERDNARIEASKIWHIISWFQLAFLLLLGFTIFLCVETSHVHPLKRFVTEMVITGGLSGFVYLFHRFFLGPWRTLTRSGAIDLVGKRLAKPC